MPASAEHEYVTTCFNEIVTDLSRVDVYTYENVERQAFDFSCTMRVNLSRAVVGQTLWKHASGIEKDIRTLLFEDTAEIKVYLVRSDATTKRHVRATIDDYRRSGLFDDRLFRLLCLDVPVFDADDEAARVEVKAALRDQVADHLLFRTVFGGLSARDVWFLLHLENTTSHDLAYNLRLLHYIRSGRYISNRGTAFDLGSNANKVRERLRVLFGAGFIEPVHGQYAVTESGETFLRMLDRFGAEVRDRRLTPELIYLLRKIGCDVADIHRVPDPASGESLRPMHVLTMGLLFNDYNPDWRIGEDLFAAVDAALPGLPGPAAI